MSRNSQRKEMLNILNAIGEAADKLPEEKLTGFMAAKGRLYKQGGLMVVGRFINGWDLGSKVSGDSPSSRGDDKYPLPSDLRDEETRKCFADRIYDSVSGEHSSPLEWVVEKWGTKESQGEDPCNTKKSAFWRAIKKVMEKTAQEEAKNQNWSSYLVWSNLYKVAPCKGGEPGDKLCDAQFNGCKALLIKEIEEYQPSRLLFLTGYDWAKHFLKGEKGSYIEASGELGKTRFVVPVYPRSKKEDEWAEEVVEAFKGTP